MATLFSALAFAGGEASADDNGHELFQRFAKTCAMKPVSGEALDKQARGVGYVLQHGPLPPDDPKQDLDLLLSWSLPDRGSDFALDAYIVGLRAHYQVICSIHADNVDLAALMESLERETTLPVPQATSSAQTGAPVYIWTVPADGATDKLEVRAYGAERRRVNVTLTYDVIAR